MGKARILGDGSHVPDERHRQHEKSYHP
jgi:hypothetical protein